MSSNIESDLFTIDDKNFVSLKVIDKNSLKKDIMFRVDLWELLLQASENKKVNLEKEFTWQYQRNK